MATAHKYTARDRYTLYAYVCGSACVRRPDVDGTISFLMIFMKRPPECRYAVVGEWDVAQHKERIFVWDMEDVRQRPRNLRVYPPAPLREFDDVDQAIMATLMMYEQ